MVREGGERGGEGRGGEGGNIIIMVSCIYSRKTSEIVCSNLFLVCYINNPMRCWTHGKECSNILSDDVHTTHDW